MYINEDKKFVFVSVPKTGSTTIHTLFQNLYHGKPHAHHLPIGDIIARNPEAVDFFRFGFVRNPWDKFVSCYFNFTQEKVHEEWAWPIKYNYKNFKEFAMDFPNTKWTKWPHFRPSFDFVSISGQIALDFVGRFENFEQDLLELATSRDLPELSRWQAQIPVAGLPKCRRSEHEHYSKYYDRETIKVIGDFYKEDIRAFDYKFN